MMTVVNKCWAYVKNKINAAILVILSQSSVNQSSCSTVKREAELVAAAHAVTAVLTVML